MDVDKYIRTEQLRADINGDARLKSFVGEYILQRILADEKVTLLTVATAVAVYRERTRTESRVSKD